MIAVAVRRMMQLLRTLRHSLCKLPKGTGLMFRLSLHE